MKRLIWVIAGMAGAGLSAQVPAWPRLEESELFKSLGSFRVPDAASNNDTISFGGEPLAYNAANNCCSSATATTNELICRCRQPVTRRIRKP